MRKVLLLAFISITINSTAQNGVEKLNAAVNNFLQDAQMKHAVLSFYVTDENGNKIYALNEQYGLSPASTQKIFTSVAAFSLLGKDFRYTTTIGYNGKIVNGHLNGDLIIKGYGDPTLGSWRYAQTKPDSILNFIAASIKNAGINFIDGNIILDDAAFEYNPTPDGYIWEDMGNYYGSGSWGINWKENQYDLYLRPGKSLNDTTTIIKTDPSLEVNNFKNLITTAEKNSGDNTILYLPPYGNTLIAEGTIPTGVNEFKITGAVAYSTDQFKNELESYFTKSDLKVSGSYITGASFILQNKPIPEIENTIANYHSPSLDSIAYWFLHKSINLYGECLLKTIGLNESNNGSASVGVYQLKKFWQQNGIDSSSINIFDGSGLSPQNRVTSFAEVNALLYAKKQSWFPAFYDALPVYNGMKIKSGTINSCKAYAGYYTAANGKKYVLSIIVNNYDVSQGSITSKLFKVLDALK
ncbi:MAG: D-alanyl-D-alanine carboxypeptidase/D-alanyl-D-alanine-endopeptidase [Bacteroidetes bacterium]|nr:D-alanyl-D-alanine carboxypeptidase/D-alanyl-D-alanine-endopeptidase [Bacteroidota bacterium]